MSKNKSAGIIFLFCSVLFFLFTGLETGGGKLLAAAVLGMWLLAAGYYVFLPKNINLRLEAPFEGRKKQKIQGSFIVEKKKGVPVFFGKAYGSVQNLLTGEKTFFVISIDLAGKKQKTFPLEICSEYMGILAISVYKAELFGLLGAGKKTWNPDMIKEIMILPETKEINIDFPLSANLMEEGEKAVPARRGWDTSSYQGVRPYEEGDSLRHIHWKMTGKTDDYMVKELGEPAEIMPVLFLETIVTKKNAKIIDALLEKYVSFSQFLIEKNMIHVLCWKEQKSGDWMKFTVNSFAGLDSTFDFLLRAGFQEGTKPSFQEAFNKWKSYGWWLYFDENKKIKIIDKYKI